LPFEAAVKAAEATLRGLKDQLNNATAKKAALTPRIDLAKKARRAIHGTRRKRGWKAG